MSGFGAITIDQALANRNLREAFRQQRCASAVRGIDFRLTYEEWLRVWMDSGHLKDRGRKRGQYVMARPGDVGAYEISNVKIVTCDQNVREAHKGKPKSPEACAKNAAAQRGKTVSIETRAKLSAALRGRPGRPPSPKALAALMARNIGNTFGKGRVPWNKGISSVPWNVGIPAAPEVRAKISASLIGNTRTKGKTLPPWTEERREKFKRSMALTLARKRAARAPLLPLLLDAA
jgi:hypothetical protein